MTRRAPIIAAVLMVACTGGAPTPGNDARAVVTRIDSNAILLRTDQGVGDPTREVIRDSTRWGDFWAQANAQLDPIPPIPPVNFADSMLLAAALGSRSSGGYSVTIDSVARGTTLRVFVTSVTPGDDCMTTMAITWPVEVVRVPRFDGSVEFVESEVEGTCK